MVYLPDEADSLARVGAAFYINMGTIFPVYAETLPHVARVLHESGKPWVLDPVAVGIGSLRGSLLEEFKKYKPSVVRGNASEVIALSGLWGLTDGSQSNVRGVDSTDSVRSARTAAVAIANHTGGAVAVSGETDLVTDGDVVVYSHGGSHFMEEITGSGCSLGGVVGIYLTAASPFIAALTATQIYNLAGARAEGKAVGTGSFQMHFLDELYNASAEDVAGNAFEFEGDL